MQLKQVSLYANLLSSLEACVETLSGLGVLSELDLGNNPCAFAEEYKHMVIVPHLAPAKSFSLSRQISLSLPWLNKLDGDQVWPEHVFPPALTRETHTLHCFPISVLVFRRHILAIQVGTLDRDLAHHYYQEKGKSPPSQKQCSSLGTRWGGAT